MTSFMTKSKFLNLSVSMMFHRSVRETTELVQVDGFAGTQQTGVTQQGLLLYKEQNPVSLTPPSVVLPWKCLLLSREKRCCGYFSRSQHLFFSVHVTHSPVAPHTSSHSLQQEAASLASCEEHDGPLGDKPALRSV